LHQCAEATKLIYLADRLSMERRDHPITGDNFISMPFLHDKRPAGRPGALHFRVSWAFYWPLTGVDQNEIHDFRSCLNLSWFLLGTPS